MKREQWESTLTADAVAERYHALLRSATPETLISGSEWYKVAVTQLAEIAHTHRVDPVLVTQVAALLSPSTNWVDNVRLTSRALGGNYDGIDGCNAAKVKALLSGMPQTWSRIQKGRVWHYTVSPNALFNSDKVTAFRDALLGDTEAICLDTHMGNAACGQRCPELVKLLFDERYGLKVRLNLKRAVRTVAYDLGLTPRDTQATIWCAWRADNVGAHYDAPVRSK